MKIILITIMVLTAISGFVFADDIITKSDDYNIKVITQKPLPSPETQNYDYSFLLSQKQRIIQDIANMQLELDKVNNLIAEADKLGIKERPKELPSNILPK